MKRTACFVCLLLSTCTVFAAAPDPIVTLYTNVFDQLRVKPDDFTIMMALVPPTDLRSAAQRKALDAVVDCLSAAADESPKAFPVAFNYYQALWSRHLYYKSTDDAKAAFAQLEKTLELAAPLSPERSRCTFELAQKTLALDAATAAKLFTGNRTDLTIKRFIAAKNAALSRGPYAARSALALANLYITKGDKRAAKLEAREAIVLDTKRGYVTNHAYDRYGIVLLAEGNADGAIAMLETAGTVQPDPGLKSLGYAHRLARALILSNREKEAIEYLERVVKKAEEGKTTLNCDLVHTLATGYTRLGKAQLAVLYWKKYIDMADPDEGRRKRATATAQRLAITAAADREE